RKALNARSGLFYVCRKSRPKNMISAEKNSAENHTCRKRCLKNGVWKKYTDTTFENTTLAIANPFPAALLFSTYAETFS
ncbi:hypothetical protein, partial [Pantoea sp.]|uniref:hypothetical protein n=1 Tax=Pantoea sp. TaxID=69393 RepID=UPI0031DAD46C